ncbi:MAG: hypothetical protein HFJ51_02685, partial [Clostridia bacterium]|nr:hypothetical protein [Clostridia bacterium]
IENCPVGALKEKDNTKEVLDKLKDKDTFVVVQTAPAVRVRNWRRIWASYSEAIAKVK